MSIEKQLVDFAVNARLEDIPDRTVTFSKYLLAKITASMVKGSGTESAKKLIRVVTEQGNPDRSAPLIGCGLRSSVEEASFVNGYFAHAAELEDSTQRNPAALDSQSQAHSKATIPCSVAWAEDAQD